MEKRNIEYKMSAERKKEIMSHRVAKLESELNDKLLNHAFMQFVKEILEPNIENYVKDNLEQWLSINPQLRNGSEFSEFKIVYKGISLVCDFVMSGFEQALVYTKRDEIKGLLQLIDIYHDEIDSELVEYLLLKENPNLRIVDFEPFVDRINGTLMTMRLKLIKLSLHSNK